MTWASADPENWMPQKKNDQLEGILIGEEKSDDYSKKYFLDLGNKIVFVWGTIVLDRQFKHVQIGTRMRVTYLGLKEGDKKRKYHDWTVEVWREDEPVDEVQEEVLEEVKK